MMEEVRRHTPTGELRALVRRGTDPDTPPLVVLHGSMADAQAWSDVAGSIDARRTVVVPNRRGRTPSAPLGGRYCVEQEVEDLTGWIAGLGTAVDLFGHSYGGLVATETVRTGADVRTLLLYDPVAPPFAEECIPALDEAVSTGDLDRAVEIINVDLSGYPQESVDSLRSTPAWPRLRELAAPAAAELHAIASFEPKGFPDGIAPVVALLAGETTRHRAPYGPAMDTVARTLGIQQETILTGQDHLAHLTGPHDLAAAIDNILPS